MARGFGLPQQPASRRNPFGTVPPRTTDRALRRGGVNVPRPGAFGNGFDYSRTENYVYNPQLNASTRPNLRPGEYADPYHGYGSPYRDDRFGVSTFLVTPVGQMAEQANPEAFYGKWTGNYGLSQSTNTAEGRWVRDQYRETVRGWEQAQLTNPFLTYRQYLAGLGGAEDWRTRFRLTPSALRGENPNAAIGPARWSVF